MRKPSFNDGLTRRRLLQLSTAGATALSAKLALPDWIVEAATQQPADTNLYSTLLQT